MHPLRHGLFGRLGRFVHSLCYDAVWNIGVVYVPSSRFLEPGFCPHVHWLPPLPRNRYAADPMVVQQDGRLFLLYEDFDFVSFRGRIFGCELSAQPKNPPVLTWPPQPVFEAPGHLSYPYLFVHQGHVYCVPERGSERDVTLYRARELPDKWERREVLLSEVSNYDNTLFAHDGQWWMLATQPDAQGRADADLHLWYAKEPEGPWQAHPRNPVKSSIACSRPAGTPFYHDGQLYRPAQDSSMTYGGRVVLQRITRLTTLDYDEEPAIAVEPGRDWPYRDGLHTLSGAGSITVIDAKRFVFNRHAFRHNLVGKLNQLKRRLFRSPTVKAISDTA